jgi:hypothetical protein
MRKRYKLLWAMGALGVIGIAAYFPFRAYESRWLPATSMVSRERLFEIIRDNSSELSKDKDFSRIQAGIQIKIIRPFASPELAIVNFNSQRLCGLAGCLYAVYSTAKPVTPMYRWLLHSNLPSSTPLFASSGNCLIVHQPATDKLVRLRYCPSGGSTYVQHDQSFLGT